MGVTAIYIYIYIYIRHRACRAREWRVVLPHRVAPTGCPCRKAPREKSLKVTSLTGAGNPEIQFLHPSLTKT